MNRKKTAFKLRRKKQIGILSIFAFSLFLSPIIISGSNLLRNENGNLIVSTSKNNKNSLNNIRKIKQISAGYQHSAISVVDQDGKDQIYVWGNNEETFVDGYSHSGNGVLGLGSSISMVDEPTLLNTFNYPSDYSIKRIEMSSYVSAAIITTGGYDELYMWGDNSFQTIAGMTPQTFPDSDIAYTPRKAVGLPKGEIIDISFSTLHAGALIKEAATGKTNLYTWGTNQRGVLGIGLPNLQGSTYVPQKVSYSNFDHNNDGKTELFDISFGNKHSFLAARHPSKSNDLIYKWGYDLDNVTNSYYSHLGKPDDQKYFDSPELDTFFDKEYFIFDKFTTGDTSTTIYGNWKPTGNDSYYALAIGNNDNGTLGVGDFAHSNITREVNNSISTSKEIKFLENSFKHSAFVKTENGVDRLYTYGGNSYGELGLGTAVDSNVPTKVSQTFLKGNLILDMSLGANHTILLTNNGVNDFLYIWGRNDKGQLGIGGITGNITTPHLLLQTNSSLLEAAPGAPTITNYQYDKKDDLLTIIGDLERGIKSARITLLLKNQSGIFVPDPLMETHIIMHPSPTGLTHNFRDTFTGLTRDKVYKIKIETTEIHEFFEQGPKLSTETGEFDTDLPVKLPAPLPSTQTSYNYNSSERILTSIIEISQGVKKISVELEKNNSSGENNFFPVAFSNKEFSNSDPSNSKQIIYEFDNLEVNRTYRVVIKNLEFFDEYQVPTNITSIATPFTTDKYDAPLPSQQISYNFDKDNLTVTSTISVSIGVSEVNVVLLKEIGTDNFKEVQHSEQSFTIANPLQGENVEYSYDSLTINSRYRIQVINNKFHPDFTTPTNTTSISSTFNTGQFQAPSLSSATIDNYDQFALTLESTITISKGVLKVNVSLLVETDTPGTFIPVNNSSVMINNDNPEEQKVVMQSFSNIGGNKNYKVRVVNSEIHADFATPVINTFESSQYYASKLSSPLAPEISIVTNDNENGRMTFKVILQPGVTEAKVSLYWNDPNKKAYVIQKQEFITRDSDLVFENLKDGEYKLEARNHKVSSIYNESSAFVEEFFLVKNTVVVPNPEEPKPTDSSNTLSIVAISLGTIGVVAALTFIATIIARKRRIRKFM